MFENVPTGGEPEVIEGHIDDISSTAVPVVTRAGLVAEPGTIVPLETVFGGRYVVNGAFPRRSRTSETYLCTWRSRPYVAKVYKEGTGFDKDASNLLMQLKSPYLARVLKAGRWEDHPYEVGPYYRNGSLEGRTFDADTICREIVPQLNRGLNALHGKGIVHGSLMPSNIMMGDDQGQFLIADYATLLAGDPEVPELEAVSDPAADAVEITYEAPEARGGHPVPESDYYSLGITLFVLYTGQMPVEQVRTADVLAPRFDYPSDMPVRLRELIIGLTHSDLSNQQNYANPNRRWTFSEVRRWCAGDTIQVPIESFGPGATIMPYTFVDQQYTSLGALVAAMAVSWEEGKRHLLGGELSKFFSETDPAFAKICERAELAAKHNPAREDAVYFETLYRLSPDLQNLYWIGEYLGTPEDAGLAFLRDAVTPQLDQMAERGALSGYMRARYSRNPDYARTMAWAEREYTSPSISPEQRAVARRVISRLLSNDFQFTVDGQNFDTLNEFAAFCLELRHDDSDEWDELAQRLVPEPGRLEPSFEAWLLALGNTDAIMSWSGGRANRNRVEPGSALSSGNDDEWVV